MAGAIVSLRIFYWERHKMGKMIKDLFTGIDGQSHDIGRWSWAICLFAVIAGVAWNALHAVVIDAKQFAEALGIVVAAHGGALWAKKTTEPPAGDPPKGEQQ
jgi:hypothetical protein